MIELTRVTVNLTPRAMAALGLVHQYEEISRTDIINRALQVYAMVVTAEPNTELSIETTTDDVMRIMILGGEQ